jgi:hypothetical protein
VVAGQRARARLRRRAVWQLVAQAGAPAPARQLAHDNGAPRSSARVDAVAASISAGRPSGHSASARAAATASDRCNSVQASSRASSGGGQTPASPRRARNSPVTHPGVGERAGLGARALTATTLPDACGPGRWATAPPGRVLMRWVGEDGFAAEASSRGGGRWHATAACTRRGARRAPARSDRARRRVRGA